MSAGMQRSFQSASVQAGLFNLSEPAVQAWEQPQWSSQQFVCSGGLSGSNSATLRHLWEECSADLALLLQADRAGGNSGPWRKVSAAVSLVQPCRIAPAPCHAERHPSLLLNGGITWEGGQVLLARLNVWLRRCGRHQLLNLNSRAACMEQQ